MADGDFPREVKTNLPAGAHVEVPPLALAYLRRQMERLLASQQRLVDSLRDQEEISNRFVALAKRIQAERAAARQQPPKTEAKVIALDAARAARGSILTQRKD